MLIQIKFSSIYISEDVIAYLFTCDLFNDAVCSPDYIASNGNMINE
jgi:hypothetical protein